MDARLIPEYRATVLGESPTGDAHTRLQAHIAWLDFQAIPLTRRREVSKVLITRCLTPFAVFNAILAPVSAVIPVLRIKLKHQGLGWIVGIQINPTEEGIFRADPESWSDFGKKVLTGSRSFSSV